MGAVDVIKSALRAAGLTAIADSNGAIEQKIIDVVGTYADSEAIERENSVTTIRTALAEQKITNIEYYRRKAVEFQIGVEIDEETMLDPVNFGLRYTSIDPAKQIIKQACIVGSFPDYVMRVNKFDETTQRLAPLTNDELNSFDDYFAYFQPLGLNMSVQSKNPAVLTDPNLVVYIASGYDGVKVKEEIEQAFVDAQKVLRKTNKVTISELVDTIQSVAGVRAVGFSSLLKARDTNLQNVEVDIRPNEGLFNLFTNAFVFDSTGLTIKVLQ